MSLPSISNFETVSPLNNIGESTARLGSKPKQYVGSPTENGDAIHLLCLIPKAVAQATANLSRI